MKSNLFSLFILFIYLIVFPWNKLRAVILVVDLAVDEQIVKQYTENSKIHIVNLAPVNQWDQHNCVNKVEDLQRFFLKEKVIDVTQIIESSYKIHGHHILGLVEAGLKNWTIVHVGFPPTRKEHLIQENYIEEEITKPLFRLKNEIIKWQPQIVQIASGDTEAENREDLLAMGLDKTRAELKAKNIMVAFKQSWLDIISSNPSVTFVVSSGNGGVDSVGDSISNDSEYLPIPAGLTLKNIIRVGSLNSEHCLSGFANYPVDVAVQGELVESWSGCLNRPKIKLSGTSQASALFTNYLAHKLDQGLKLSEFLSDQKDENCLKNRVKFKIK